VRLVCRVESVDRGAAPPTSEDVAREVMEGLKPLFDMVGGWFGSGGTPRRRDSSR
jgi:hypothetical protein